MQSLKIHNLGDLNIMVQNYSNSQLSPRFSELYLATLTMFDTRRISFIGRRIKKKILCVPYHGGGRSKKINAWYLNTLMVYL